MINHGAHGYAKFVIDEMTIRALETGLHKIESSLDRKQIYNILLDIIISGSVAGIRVIEIIKLNMAKMEQEDVITDVFRAIVPILIKQYIPHECAFKIFDQMFQLAL